MSKKVYITIGIIILLLALSAGVWAYARATVGLPVYIYHFNTRTNQLEAERRVIPANETAYMVQSVIPLFYEPPRGNGLVQTIPHDLFFDEIRITGSVMEIFFPRRYHQMAPYEEGLFRAALIQTMFELPFINIDGVKILVGGEELLGPFGTPLGVQTADIVLISPPIMPRIVFNPTITLYFVSDNIDGLLREEREVLRPDGVLLEQVIVEELIAGPNFAGRMATIPRETQIREVRTEMGLSTINLSEEFISNFGGHQTLAELTLQSIVHSIMENVSGVTGIRFLIESESRENFSGVPYFDTTFEREE